MTKAGFTMNKPFIEAFGIVKGQYVRVAFLATDKTRKLGIKLVPLDDPKQNIPGNLRVLANNFHGKEDKTLHVCCSGLTKRLPDCWKRAFRARLNSGERIIEIDLSPNNELLP